MPAPPTKPGGRWYRQPVLWLGVAVFVASMAGCVWIIVVSARHADTPLDTSHTETVFGVPASAHGSRTRPR
jgi:hypothetical protein